MGAKNESTVATPSKETAPKQDQNKEGTEQGKTGIQTSASAGGAGTPATALASLSGMMPLQMLNSIGGVEGAVGSHIGNERDHLKENPPSLERPAGSPQRKEEEKPQNEAKEKNLPQKSKEIQEKQAPAAKEPAPLPPAKPMAVENTPSPQIRGDESGKPSGDDVTRLQNAVVQLPTTDPELKQDGGPAPAVALSEGADPSRITEQSGKTGETIGDAHTKSKEEAAMPMGEEQLFPVVPRETLSAKIEGGSGTSGPGGAKARAGAQSPAAASGGAAGTSTASAGGADSIQEASSYIAHEESGKSLQASLNQAGSNLQAKDQERTRKVQEENKKLNQESAKLVEQNAKEQAQQRSEGQKQVASFKSNWSKEQGDLVRNADVEKAKLRTEGNREIATAKSAGDREAHRHIQEGNRVATQARHEAESTAAREKAKAKKQESGFFGWVASKVEAFFDGIKAAIKTAFEKARALVRSAIEGAKRLAAAAIAQAQRLATAIVQRVGKAIIAIGDRVLAAFPKLRQKFRNAIQSAVTLAQKAINRLADALKKGVQKLLDLAGRAINAVLSFAEKAMLAVVDTYKKAIVGAINAAKAFVDKVGMFAALIKDIAVDPLGWLGKLGTSAMDGIRNHLWNAFQTAVKEWFNQKLESVLGMGKAVWDMIKKGGISLAQIGSMAWNAIKSMIPPALIAILIEKLVSMIVPAAGAVKLIIEGLVAAWGAVQRILAAFEKFFAFLMAVKTGQAGKKFADAIAAAALAVIDFVANWLLMKLGKGLLKAGKKIAQWVRKKFRKVKDKFKKRNRRKGKKDRKSKGKKKEKGSGETKAQKEARLRKAVEETKALGRKKGGLALLFKLHLWKIKRKYRLRTLKATFRKGKAKKYDIKAVINPQVQFEMLDISEAAKSLRKKIQELLSINKNELDVKSIRRLGQDALRSTLSGDYQLHWIGLDDRQTLILKTRVSDTNPEPVGDFVFQDEYEKVIEGNKNTIYKNKRTGKTYVKDNLGQYVPQFIQRALSDRDIKNNPQKRGILPTGEKFGTADPLQHAIGTKPSKFTSWTKQNASVIAEPGGKRFAEGTEVATINLFLISSKNIFDLSTKIAQKEYRFRSGKKDIKRAVKDVIRTSEVLIKGYIPPESIISSQ